MIGQRDQDFKATAFKRKVLRVLGFGDQGLGFRDHGFGDCHHSGSGRSTIEPKCYKQGS